MEKASAPAPGPKRILIWERIRMEEFRLAPTTKEYWEELYRWNTEEKNTELFTCRPVPPPLSWEEYTSKMERGPAPGVRSYVLTRAGTPLGRIRMFDYNPRNQSAEFGYYLPEQNRGRGYGTAMSELFLAKAFQGEDLPLNKPYATTSSGNPPSCGLLQKPGFSLDGRMREHYWIGERKYDQMIFSLLKREWETKIR